MSLQDTIKAMQQLNVLSKTMKYSMDMATIARAAADMRGYGREEEYQAAITLAKGAFDPEGKLTRDDFAERLANIAKATLVGYIRPHEFNDTDVMCRHMTVHGPSNMQVVKTFKLPAELAAMIRQADHFQDFKVQPRKVDEAKNDAAAWLNSIEKNPAFKADTK